jgi:RND family efflux transporter MFP subunit
MTRPKPYAVISLLFFTGLSLTSCGKNDAAQARTEQSNVEPEVAVAKLTRKPMSRQLTISAELVPFQEIEVFAKESGYVSELLVDYGSRVHKGQLMAVLEIPEMQATLQEDQASMKSASEQIANAQHQLNRMQAQHNVLHMQYQRLDNVSKTQEGLVAQQEIDDAQGKDLATEAQVEGAQSNLQMAQSELAVSQSKLAHDQALYDYARITAPFDGVVTQRYANLGTLMQAGTSSSTQAMPLVKLSQESVFRLVIPVPESYVRYIKIGDPVNVKVSALGRDFPGKVARFSVDVGQATRTMHTEVDVPNPERALIPGLYAEATLALDRVADALAVPLQAVNQTTDQASVMIVDSSNKVQTRPITLGIQTPNEAEVLSGLNEGDRVVLSDRSGLKPGESVQPRIAQAATYQSQN